MDRSARVPPPPHGIGFALQLLLDETLGMVRWLGRAAKAQLQPHLRAGNLLKVIVSLRAALTRDHQINDLWMAPGVEKQCMCA